MDEQRQDDQLEPICNSSVPIQDVALKTYQKRWTIEKVGSRGSGRSVLTARHDNVSYIFLLSLWVEEYRILYSIFVQCEKQTALLFHFDYVTILGLA